MTYINGFYNKSTDEVIVWERTSHDERVCKHYPAPYYFYHKDDNGSYTSLYGDKLSRKDFSNRADFEAGQRQFGSRNRLFESDIDPFRKVLMNEYYNTPSPLLNYTFLDIEVDYDSDRGFSSPSDPYALINAITYFNQWENQYYTIGVTPVTWRDARSKLLSGEMTKDEAIEKLKLQRLDDVNDYLTWVDQDMIDQSVVEIVDTERELLLSFLNGIKNTDIISGWNSEFFDLPYIVKRIEHTLGSSYISMLAFDEYSARSKYFYTSKMVERYGEDAEKMELKGGLMHFDYMALMKKWDGNSRASWSLANISAESLPDMPKLEYDGTLEGLYVQDFNFFLRYNIRDVEVLEGLDKSYGFIDQALELAHLNCIPLPKVEGSVAMIDTGIINYMHYELDKICPDFEHISGPAIEGALVMTPNRGLWPWIGSVDLASLYPSTMRSINISPEKIIGQFKPNEDQIKNAIVFVFSGYIKYVDDLIQSGYKVNKNLVGKKNYLEKMVGNIDNNSSTDILRAIPEMYSVLNLTADKDLDEMRKWPGVIHNMAHELVFEGISKSSDDKYTLTFEHGAYAEHTGEEWYQILRFKKWCISGYGTVFDQSTGEGALPGILRQWYEKRKEYKREMVKWEKVAEEILERDGEKNDEWKAADAKRAENHRKQMAYKLNLNSLYGACINEWSKFYDPRLGASTTGTGRSITAFMVSKSAELITSEFTEVKKRIIPKVRIKNNSASDTDIEADYTHDCKNIIYGDTDSVYFSMPLPDSPNYQDMIETAVELADTIGNGVNDAFPAFMDEAHCSTEGFREVVACDREIVANRGLFQTKKKYVCHVVDNEGFRTSKIKAMGSDIKKLDTPKVIQAFLKTIVNMILKDNKNYEDLETYINDYRTKFKSDLESGDLIEPLKYAVSKGCNNLDAYTLDWERTEKIGNGKCRLPGNVRAAINYNEQLKLNLDTASVPISNGNKIRILYVKSNNRFGYTSIAINADSDSLPPWFYNDFEIDSEKMEKTLIDGKVELLFDAIGWEVPTPRNSVLNSVLLY